MEYLVNSTEMKQMDRNTIEEFGMPSLVLMERAALSAVEVLEEDFDLGRILVVCGSGNNGADGVAVARLLHLKKKQVAIYYIGNREKASKENREQVSIATKYGIPFIDTADFSAYTTIVDAIFGIGLTRQVGGEYATVIKEINASGKSVLALDMPSGISTDNGEVMGIAIQAKKTVSFAYKKLGTVLFPGAAFSGEVIVKDIGITDDSFQEAHPSVFSFTIEDIEKMPKRKAYSNKGTYGKVLVIAGSPSMCGAAYFSASAAYKMGAGLVKIYTSVENKNTLQMMIPEAIVTSYKKGENNRQLLEEAINWASVIVLGPGLGVGNDAEQIVKQVLSSTKIPVVIDADALNIMAQHPELMTKKHNHWILTPHLGEMARLTRKDIPYLASNIVKEAKAFAAKHMVVCVLKDTRTVVSDGTEKVYVNQSGNSGMAKGGSGDVLTGIIAGLLAQGLNEMEASSLGVYIHGLVGEAAKEQKGEYSMVASNLIASIYSVIS